MTRPSQRSSDASADNQHRVASFTSGDVFVVYDRENSDAWIEADTTVDPEEMV
jgi:hypothetical protein